MSRIAPSWGHGQKTLLADDLERRLGSDLGGLVLCALVSRTYWRKQLARIEPDHGVSELAGRSGTAVDRGVCGVPRMAKGQPSTEAWNNPDPGGRSITGIDPGRYGMDTPDHHLMQQPGRREFWPCVGF